MPGCSRIEAPSRGLAPEESELRTANRPRVKGSRQRYGVLLVALTATFLFEGIAQPGDLQRTFGTVLVGATLMLALYAAEIPPHRLRGAGVIVLLIVLGVVVAALAGRGRTVVAIAALTNGLLVALAPPAVVVGLQRNLRATGSVTLPVVAGVLCLYLLVGLFFAFIFTAIQAIGGSPFFANGASATSARSVYFSFVTLATLGYGDYTARTNFGHTLSMTEALLGQLYLVTIVATIVTRIGPVRLPSDGGERGRETP